MNNSKIVLVTKIAMSRGKVDRKLISIRIVYSVTWHTHTETLS